MMKLFVTTISAVLFPVYSLLAVILLVPSEYDQIQQAINNAIDGDTVLVSPGVYSENLNFNGKRILLCSEYLFQPDDIFIRQTIIDGGQPTNGDSASVVSFVSGENSSAILHGFTIANGLATMVPGSYIGGGVLITTGSSPIIQYNIFRDNNALIGGGIAIRNAWPQIKYNAFYKNNAYQGAGISVENSYAFVSHNVFWQNFATTIGGVLYSSESYVEFVNNIAAYNRAAEGGGLVFQSSSCNIGFSDFFENQNGNFVGIDDIQLGDTSLAENFNRYPADPYLNIFVDPLLTDPHNLDFVPDCTSPMIDAGNTIPATYPDGGARTDIGMFEIIYRVADFNYDKKINLVDATALVNIIFNGEELPCPVWIADFDCSRRVSITDVVALIAYWAGYGGPPCGIEL